MDKIADPSGEDLAEILRRLKEAYRLKAQIALDLSAEPFLLGRTTREEEGYRIHLSGTEVYPLFHEFYHVLAEERVMKRHIGSRCGFCTKIVQEMENVLTDLAIERIVHETNPRLFPAYFPRIRENLDTIARCGVLSFDPTRTVAYNLYLETAIEELYPDLREDYDFWSRIDLSDELREGVESALEIASTFVREGRLSWKEISRATVDLSWSIFGADVMFIESQSEYRIVCNTSHHSSKEAVSEMITRLRRLSQDWRRNKTC